MANEWYIHKSDRRFGPFTPQQLRDFAATQKLGPSDMLWKEGMQHPIEASRIKGLFDQAANQPKQNDLPPPVPPPIVAAPPLTSPNLLPFPPPSEWSTGKGGTTTARKSVQSRSDFRLLHVLLLIPCFPIGLFLIWRSNQWSMMAKLLWSGGVGGFLILGIVGSSMEREATNESLTGANSLWQAGKQADAVDQYRAILERHWFTLEKADRATLVRRVVEFDVGHGNESAATTLIEKAVRDKLALTFQDGKAQRLQSAVQDRIAREQAQSRQNASSATSAGGAVPSSSTASAKYEIKKGTFKGKLTLELPPDVAQEIALSHFDISGNYLRFTVEYKASKKSNAYTGLAFDSDGVKLEQEVMAHNGGEAGEKEKAYILFTDISKIKRVSLVDGGYGPVRVRIED